MGQYSVDHRHITGESRRWLKHQDDSTWREIHKAIAQIAECPRGGRPTYGHLKGPDHCLWRYRHRRIRIVYDVDDGNRVIGLLRILPRRDVYRRP